ncbi:MAG: hypothetical protein OES18_24130 [Deltaproteobacteria bacterium]|nr:hypothetical protein [Deltaproteobacteria bacterium]
MSVLPGVLGCRTLRRTVQVRLGSNPLRFPGTRRKRLRCAWHSHLHGLATPIRAISGLKQPARGAGCQNKYDVHAKRSSIIFTLAQYLNSIKEPESRSQ